MHADSTDYQDTSTQTRHGHTVGRLAIAPLLLTCLLVACGSNDDVDDPHDADPAKRLSEAATEIADDLYEAAIDVGDERLDYIADDLHRRSQTTGQGLCAQLRRPGGLG